MNESDDDAFRHSLSHKFIYLYQNTTFFESTSYGTENDQRARAWSHIKLEWLVDRCRERTILFGNKWSVSIESRFGTVEILLIGVKTTERKTKKKIYFF